MPHSDLKKKTTTALVWNALDKVGVQVVQFAVGVITARLLLPRDFGLIGALAIFTMLSNLLIESGFSAALIRRKNVTRGQYSAVLYFNLGVSILLYAILFFCAPLIAAFFEMPELTTLSRFLFLAIIFNSLGIVQTVIFTKEFKFKILTTTNLVSLIITGVVTVWMAMSGYSYWAIAWQQVLMVTLRVVLLWFCSDFRPVKTGDFTIIREMFRFSSLLLMTGIINVIGKNVYNIIIGKFYKIDDLGYYTQAQKYQSIPSTVITATLQGVALPVMSEIHEDQKRHLAVFRKIIRMAAFLIFPVMLGMHALAEPLITILLTEKWLQSVEYFKILVLASLVFPFHSLFLQYFMAKGNSKNYLMLEIIRNAMMIISLAFAYHSIVLMLVGFAVSSLLSYLIDAFLMQKEIKYSFFEHAKDIVPYLGVSIGMYAVVMLVGLLPLGLYSLTALQLIAGILFYFGCLKILGSKIFEEVLSLIQRKK